jgi:acyl carrier protein
MHEEDAMTTDPARALEDTIAGYWKQLLGIEVVQPTDDFIGLGGNSILATMLANRIEDELGVRPEIAELFTTLAQVAVHCAALGATAVPLGRAGGGA